MAYKGAAAALTVPTRREEKWLTDGTFQVALYWDNFKYTALVAIKPAGGTELTTLGYTGTYVIDATISTTPTATANMVVTASSAVTWVGTPGDGIVQEVEWVPLQEDIRYHPIYQSGGLYSLTDALRVKVEQALSGEITEASMSSSSATHLYDRLRRGQTTYTIYAPVARKVTPSSTSPSSSGAGQIIGVPPFFGAPPSSGNGKPYKYVKTADAFTRQAGRWSRREEWTGFEQIDSDIYGAL